MKLTRLYEKGINKDTIGMYSTMDLICKICAKKFKFQSGLSRHVRTHRHVTVQCRCGVSFSRWDNMKRHQIMSLTCGALDITNVAPGVLPENEVKEDLANNQADKGNDSAHTESNDVAYQPYRQSA